VQEHEGEPEGEGEGREGEGEGGEVDRQGGEELRPVDDSLAQKQFKILVDLIDKVSTRIPPKKAQMYIK
jgi:hypothetical protein